MEFKDKIKQIRADCKLSQSQLAKLLVSKGVLKTCTNQYISAMENKSLTNEKLFTDIANLLGYEVQILKRDKKEYLTLIKNNNNGN